MEKTKKKVNFALQGGGAHGAFTWGMLDKFLETSVFEIEAISATSAGSMNAVILAQGLMDGGQEKARQLLHDFWFAISEYGKLSSIASQHPMHFYFFHTLMHWFSPYDLNPFDFNPIREILNKVIDIERLKTSSPIKLFICATNVQTGKIRIFNNNELSIEAILASACLPKLFQTIEIEGEYFWDGGYLGNPAIFPLIYNTQSSDILILHVVPIERKIIPNTAKEIDNRVREISFNSSLMREMRAIAFVTKLIDEQWIKPEYENRFKRLYLHCLRADKALSAFPLTSAFIPDWSFLLQLKELGRESAAIWLKENEHAIGKCSTIHFDEWL